MTTPTQFFPPDPPQLAQAQDVVRKALESQGARHPRAKTDALAFHLMTGGTPATYAERTAQMALQLQGLLPEAQA
jgi:hypothetical protein